MDPTFAMRMRVEQVENGQFLATSVDLPGLVAQGRTVEEALEIANDSPYGLAASIWTKNIDKALGMIRRVNGGRTWINTTIAGGPGQPLGGYRQSGVGREAGLTGVEEYTEVKSVHVGIGKRNHWIS